MPVVSRRYFNASAAPNSSAAQSTVLGNNFKDTHSQGHKAFARNHALCKGRKLPHGNKRACKACHHAGKQNGSIANAEYIDAHRIAGLWDTLPLPLP